jgi:hypothetical protein
MKNLRAIFFLFIFLIFLSKISVAQIQNDSTANNSDSSQQIDSAVVYKKTSSSLDSFLKKNKYLNAAPAQVSLATKQKTRSGKEALFYLLSITILLLALFKVFYTKYFNNIFRVFFNTSLRQNQLTDILLQSKLPSLIFNFFFIISFGLYLWLLASHYYTAYRENFVFAGLSILFIAIIYTGKFIFLKFIGWVCGISDAAEQYIFVIFLINKIIGILIIPFIVLAAFSLPGWIYAITVSSFLILGILFLMRYLRSYGLLQNQLKCNRFHFLIYIAAAEFLPVLIIYKLFINYIN